MIILIMHQHYAVLTLPLKGQPFTSTGLVDSMSTAGSTAVRQWIYSFNPINGRRAHTEQVVEMNANTAIEHLLQLAHCRRPTHAVPE